MQTFPACAGSLEGGAVAIQCLGTGSLASVRVIYRSRRNSYFFGVDCQVPGIQQTRRLGPAAPSKGDAKPGMRLCAAGAVWSDVVCCVESHRIILYSLATSGTRGSTDTGLQ